MLLIFHNETVKPVNTGIGLFSTLECWLLNTSNVHTCIILDDFCYHNSYACTPLYHYFSTVWTIASLSSNFILDYCIVDHPNFHCDIRGNLQTQMLSLQELEFQKD